MSERDEDEIVYIWDDRDILIHYDNGASLYMKIFVTGKGLLVEIVDQQKEFRITDKELVTLYEDELDKIDRHGKKMTSLKVLLSVILFGSFIFILHRRQKYVIKHDGEHSENRPKWEKVFTFLMPVAIPLILQGLTFYYGYFHAGVILPITLSLLFCLIMVDQRRKPLRQRITHFGILAMTLVLFLLIMYGF